MVLRWWSDAQSEVSGSQTVCGAAIGDEEIDEKLEVRGPQSDCGAANGEEVKGNVRTRNSRW